MRIVIVSDTQNTLNKMSIPDGDILLEVHKQALLFRQDTRQRGNRD
jgi:hypothetical protein